MQQLEIVYSGIKGAILVRKSLGPPTEELPLFNFKEGRKKKYRKAQFIFPSAFKYVRQLLYPAIVIILQLICL